MPVEPIPCAPDGGGTPGACNCSPSIATTPLCREDGTSVLLVVRSPCVTCGSTAADPVVVGWIDPTTGVLTPGPAPADTGPCDTPGCVETICRQLCDDTNGDGAPDTTYSELWCIRADGSADLVLVYQDDPSTPYVPVSPVDCTYGCPEHETVMLCDDTGPFLRRYVFLAGTATFEDVALDGQTPHVVTGTVGVCPAAPDCASPTTPTTAVGLCLADGTPIAVLLTRDCDGVTAQAGWINLLTGAYSAGAPPAGAGGCGDGSAFDLTGVLCDTDPATGDVLGLVLIQYAYNPDGSLAGVELINPADGTPYTLQGELLNCPGGGDLPEQDIVVLCDVAADGTSTPFMRDYRRNTAGLVTGHTDYRLDGTVYTVAGTVTTCQPEQPEPCGDSETLPLCDLQLDGTAVPFLRRLTYDCAGAVVDSADTTLDGLPYAVLGTVGHCPTEVTGLPEDRDVESYPLCVIDNASGTVLQHVRREVVYDQTGAQVGERIVDAVTGGPVALPGGAHLGVCTPEVAPCRTTSTLLVCDLPTDGAPAPTVIDTPGAPYYPYTTGVATPGAQALWDGGTLTLPAAAGPQPGTGGTVRTAAAIIQAPRPVCDTGTAHVTVHVDVTQLGPDNGCRATGFVGLYTGPGDANRIALALAPPDTPAGWSGTLTVEADVPAADLAAGTIAVAVAFDAYDDSGATCPPPRHTGWQLAEFSATVVYDQTGCATQFLRSVTTDCESGAVVSVHDTTLDGDPYMVTGEPGQCTAAGGGQCCPEQPCPAQSVIEQCRCDDTDGDGLPDVEYVELLAVDCTGALTSIGTYTEGLTGPYTPVAPVDCCAGEDQGADPALGVQARRIELPVGGVWDAATYKGTLRSITATAHTGTGEIVTVDGTSTLYLGESVTWGIDKDADAALAGPLTITATNGVVTVAFTTGVNL
jgi:hypothetical protein